ncbi:MAG: response regulator, partial [Deltaproteobacteria bacterium]|nr:response regulator [Deltaproteobacteria bacterium]
MKKILVVDNDKFMLEFMNDILSERGHKVVTAEGGLPAVDILKTYTPDIIFVDLVMPNIEGKQLCKIIRSMPELKDVAIVILSAIAAEEDIKIKELKADACIAKGPVNKMAKHILKIVDEFGRTSLRGDPGETIGVPDIYSRNITKELLSIKNHFQIILGKMSEGVLEVTSGGRIVYANSIALSIIEIPEEKLLGSHFIDLFAADDRHRVAELMKPSGGKPEMITEEFPLRLNGHQITLQFVPINEYAATSLVILNDITERLQAEEEKKKLEAQLHQANKMEAIATLAGGVAHEFNNALMGIMGNIELLKMDLPEDERRDRYFGAMKDSSHRMSRLTDQLLAYAQGGKYQPKNLKLDAFVIQTLQILQHDLSPEVRVETHFSKVSYIKADNAQMQMVLSAILANSNEAIEDEGLIKITAGNEDVDEDFAKQHPGLKPGPYVCLAIEDDGKGMDEETGSRIFEPFFTTKFQGRGMGMAAVYGIVKNHDGWISVD